MISKKRYKNAEQFLNKINNSSNKVVSTEAATKHVSYLLEHIKTLEGAKQ